MAHTTLLEISRHSSCILVSEDLFTFTHSVDPDEMQHYAAFHMGLHCLQKYLFRGFLDSKGLN